MSKGMRVFCLLSTVSLIAGAVWLHSLGVEDSSFLAACFVYPLGCIVLVGEAFAPLSKDLPNHPYKGESRTALARRALKDLQRLNPNSWWLANYSAVKAGLILGFVAWVILLGIVYFR